jgi:predicted DNA-binding transcriptional regulator YafY
MPVSSACHFLRDTLMSTPTPAGHDTLVRRLASVLVKLNQGETLEPRALAEEFGVNLRTIQRDLNQRFGYLPIEKVEGGYRLDPAFLGRIGTKDIERFAALAGIQGLFPSLSDEFLRDVFDTRMQGALLVKGHHYESLSGREPAFRTLEQAIVSRRTLSFRYRKADGERRYEGVEPYRLVNHKGIWYLFALDRGTLKSFAFTRIEAPFITAQTFTIDAAVEARITQEEGIWFTESTFDVVLSIAPEVAPFFRRRQLIANQQIIEERPDGGLLLSARVGHLNQVLPHVRYWIPNIRIVSPEGMQQQLDEELRAYLEAPRSGR